MEVCTLLSIVGHVQATYAPCMHAMVDGVRDLFIAMILLSFGFYAMWKTYIL